VDLGTGRTIVTLWGLDNFQYALLDDATLNCWGHNDDGQICYGDTSHRCDNANEWGTTWMLGKLELQEQQFLCKVQLMHASFVMMTTSLAGDTIHMHNLGGETLNIKVMG